MKPLPVPIEAERALLGAVLQKNALTATAEGLQADDFGLPAHRRVWRAILACAGDGADVVSVTDHLHRAGELEAVGGAETVSGLVDGVPRLSSVARYSAIIQQDAQRRRIIEGALRLGTIAQERTAEEALQELQRLSGETSARSAGGVYSAKRWADEEETDFRRRLEGKAPGLPTGLHDLDGLLSPGLQPGELWFVGARPSVGKTSFLLLLLDRNVRRGRRCVHLALEMGAVRNLWRLLSIRSGVLLASIRKPVEMDEAQREAYSRAWAELHEAPNLAFHDCPGASVDELAWRIRQAREALGGLDLVTVDYFQLIDFGRAESGYEGRTLTAQKLAALAVRERVALVVGSQLNRGAETDSERDRPTRADLEGTGRLEQVASGVLLLHRWNRRSGDPITPGEIIVDKNQDGRLGIVRAEYFGPCARWQGAP